MCTMSMIGDYYSEKWRTLPYQTIPNTTPIFGTQPAISREEFEQLKREVADMKELLKRAKAYDEKNGEPDCEMDEKMAVLRKVAEMVGVDLSDVIGKPLQS